MRSTDSIQPDQLALMEAIAAARGQTVVEMMQSLAALEGDVDAELEQLLADRPALALETVLPVIDALPTLKALSEDWSPIHAKLVTHGGMELIAVACDFLGPTSRCIVGMLSFPGEERAAERMKAHAVTGVNDRAVFLPFDEYAASVLDEKPGEERTFVFTIHAAALESAPGLAEA